MLCSLHFLLILVAPEQIELEATTQYSGTPLRAPTTESGFAPACKDTCWGDLTLKMWERSSNGSKGKVCFVQLDHILSCYYNCGRTTAYSDIYIVTTSTSILYQGSPCFIEHVNNCLVQCAIKPIF